jgi:hypothetical protein
MEQLVILIIIGLISLVNWVMQKAAEQREATKMKRVEKREVRRESKRNIYTQPAPAAAPPVARRQTVGRDPFKDLMDALGLPSDEAPPPPVVRREEFFEQEEFASVEEAAPPPVPAPGVKAPRWQAPSVRRPDEKTAQLASAFAAVGEKPASAYRASKLHDLLASRDSQRKAIVLAEILGTPRGLAPFRMM